MQFVFEDGVYKVVRITGPQHNLLGIRISNLDAGMKVVPLLGTSGDAVRISERDVLNQVKSGLSIVNNELSKKYFISEAQFVPSDTFSPDVYELLTIALIKRIDSGERFVVIETSSRRPQ